ncbi:MAG: hypothetical protein IPP94_06190 [Ignavibacteria bacterium]|nr:hypothetical protein [Ignavibacteria bacterium]
MEVFEEQIIRTIVDLGMIVIALGGGGIPVIARDAFTVDGCEAVIDKDRASALLASGLGVDLFIISTDAEQVYVDFKKPSQRGIRHATADEMQAHLDAGQFPPGSMGPKVQSALRFLRAGGTKVIITSYEHLTDALDDKAGTHITPSALCPANTAGSTAPTSTQQKFSHVIESQQFTVPP